MKNVKSTMVIIVTLCIIITGILTNHDFEETLEPNVNGYEDAYLAQLEQWMESDKFRDLVPDWYKERYANEHDNPITVPENPTATEPIAAQTPSEQYYPDVPSDAWYAEAINAMTKGGLLNGYPDGLFHPDDYVTQGQFAHILAEFYGLEPIPGNYLESRYCAVCGIDHERIYPTAHWALADYWNVMGTGGYGYPALCGVTLDNPVWRGDVLSTMPYGVAVAIPGYYQELDSDGNYIDKWLYQTDKVWTESDIPDWDIIKNTQRNDATRLSKEGHGLSRIEILISYNLGITHGVDANGTCDPEKPMTRAELCQVFYNLGITQKGQANGYFRRHFAGVG